MEAAKTIAELFSHLFELEPEKKEMVRVVEANNA